VGTGRRSHKEVFAILDEMREEEMSAGDEPPSVI